MKPSLKVTDNLQELLKGIKALKGSTVLVGIPEDENARSKGPIGNAALLAINNFGSPENNIPARPVMQIGMRNAQDDIAREFRGAAREVLSGNARAVGAAYERAGIIASTSIKKAINDQEGIEPPSQATLDAREARGFEGTSALIVTGAMRNAITYVVKES